MNRGEVVRGGEVGAVEGAGPEDGPEGAALVAGAETGNVHVSREAALLEGSGEGCIGDVVVVEDAEEDGEVIVTVWEDVSCRLKERCTGVLVPIRGVFLSICKTRCSIDFGLWRQLGRLSLGSC